VAALVVVVVVVVEAALACNCHDTTHTRHVACMHLHRSFGQRDTHQRTKSSVNQQLQEEEEEEEVQYSRREGRQAGCLCLLFFFHPTLLPRTNERTTNERTTTNERRQTNERTTNERRTTNDERTTKNFGCSFVRSLSHIDTFPYPGLSTNHPFASHNSHIIPVYGYIPLFVNVVLLLYARCTTPRDGLPVQPLGAANVASRRHGFGA